MNPANRMKTVYVDGVPYRMRADMPGYEEMIQKDQRDDEIQDAYDEGWAAAREHYAEMWEGGL